MMQDNSMGINFAGHFLIAMPGINSDLFDRSVIYVFEHSSSGALGLMVNRMADVKVSELLEKLNGVDAKSVFTLPRARDSVMFGGPVQTDRGFVLHTPSRHYASSIQVNDDLVFTSSNDILEDLVLGHSPQKMLLALGYSGWVSGQLEDEIKNHLWLTVYADPYVLFDTSPREKYDHALRLLGFNEAKLSSVIGHA